MTIQNLTKEQIFEAAANETHRTFLSRFYEIADEFEVVAEDSNGTGYYDGLVLRSLRKPVGSILRAITPGANNRRMLVVVTPVGNVVIFERFTGGDKGVLVSNVPLTLRHMLNDGSVKLDMLNVALGGEYGTPNIGLALSYILEAARDIDFNADRLGSPRGRH